MNKFVIFFIAIFSTLLFSTSVLASSINRDRQPIEWRDFRIIEPRTDSLVKNNREPVVIEFFWYGCPHCFRIKPMLEDFIKNNPHVKVIRYPLVFEGWESGAKIFFTLERLGLLEEFHSKIFSVIHTQRNGMLRNPQLFFHFMKTNGVDENRVSETYRSFTVSSNLHRARFASKAYDVQGTPSFALHIDGKVKLVEPARVGGFENAIRILEQLTKKETQ